MTQQQSLAQFASKVTLTLLTVSVGVNIVQANKILAMSRPASATARVGTAAVALEGKRLDGQTARLEYRDRPTLLYWFSSKCYWCERNWPNVREVANAAGTRYRFVAVTAESRADIDKIALNVGTSVEFLTEIRQADRERMTLSGTPQLFVIGTDGVISHAWRGAFIDRTARQIESLLGVTLPGLMPDPRSAQ